MSAWKYRCRGAQCVMFGGWDLIDRRMATKDGEIMLL